MTRRRRISLSFLSVVFLVVSVLVVSVFYLSQRILPKTFISEIAVGLVSKDAAIQLIEDTFRVPESITLTYQGQVFDLPKETLAITYDFAATVDTAYAFGHGSRISQNIADFMFSISGPRTIAISHSFDRDALIQSLSVVAGQVSTPPQYPSLVLVSGDITVQTGKQGAEMDTDYVLGKIEQQVASGMFTPIEISIKPIDPSLTQQEARTWVSRATRIVTKQLVLTFENYSLTLEKQNLLTLLGGKGGYDASAIDKIVNQVSDAVNRDAQNPTITIEEEKVHEFLPSKDGVEVNKQSLTEQLVAALASLETQDNDQVKVDVPVTKTAPQITMGEINNLGIRELIGRGTSRYKGSIAGRIHNVALAATKINGTLIAPGETFSFNTTLGDVSKFTGYKTAYIIKDGKTILGDGGGVCQVSTTLFRAVLAAGLPITERHAHAYRVGFYEQDSGPGLDATVYAPTPDFKFKNNTPGHILIQAQADSKNVSLVFELYGTSDGRVSSVSKPKILSSTPPLPDLYQDDPTLPAGVVKQVEHAAWGAKVTFDYVVTRGDETLINHKFVSNYRPWQAVYLRGTGPAQ